MSDPAITQVEDRFKAILQAYGPLTGQTVIIAESLDVAVDEGSLPAILITNTSWAMDIADENWNTRHDATFEVEAITALPSTGTISRANRTTLSHVIAAIAADRSLGIGVNDTQETDIAPAEPRGKDVDSASLQFNVRFFTSRSDWFTII